MLLLITVQSKNYDLELLNSGVYLPAAYLGLLLFFAVAVQLVLGIQWLVLMPPRVVFRDAVLSTSSEIGVGSVITWPPLCNKGFAELLLSLIYVMFLLFFVGVLSIKSCGIRENYRESTYIAISVGCITGIWLTWMVLGLVMGEEYEDPCVAFGLVGAATVTFLIMFLPKGRQLAAMGQEGLYIEDRDDMLSNATPSAFAPSFYHFTPAVVPVWDSSPNAIYKNAMTERKCHKLGATAVLHTNRPKQKLVENGVCASRCLGPSSPNLTNSMMY